jgi:K+-sensing histidine kinase KdpD
MYGSIKSKRVNAEGIGLGLIIVKLIVEKFGGAISFASKWKKGTTFLFSFECENVEPEEYTHAEMMRIQSI